MTALRELAERWKGDGCRNGSSHECADELLSILAEGDGEAVPVAQLRLRLDRWDVVGIHGEIEKLHLPSGEYPLYTHPQPVRSGVVSDEDVLDAERYRWLRANAIDLIEEDRGNGSSYPYGDDLDAAIDAAMQGESNV